MFWTFLLLTEKDMASCSRTFRKSKSAKEERNLIENAILKWQNGHWKIFWNGRMVGKTKIQQSSLCAFTTDKSSKVQRLDTDMANMTAESLNFWLIKFVLLMLCKSKFTLCEISWNNVKYAPTICCQLRVDN